MAGGHHGQSGHGGHGGHSGAAHGQADHGQHGHSGAHGHSHGGTVDPNSSFRVHLQSLTDFGGELQTQLQGIDKPADGLATMAGTPIVLGAFGEAYSLVGAHSTSVQQIHDLLSQTKQALQFAEDVTNTVAKGYKQADDDVHAVLTSGLEDSTVTPTGDLADLTNQAQQALHGTTETVTVTVDQSVVAPLENAIQQVTGVTPTVTPAVPDVTQAATQSVLPAIAPVTETVAPVTSTVLPGSGS